MRRAPARSARRSAAPLSGRADAPAANAPAKQPHIDRIAKEGRQARDVTIATVMKSQGYATGQFGKSPGLRYDLDRGAVTSVDALPTPAR